MAAGDFLLVVPAGWVEVPNAFTLLNTGLLSEDSVIQGIWYEIDNALENSGLIPEGYQTINGRIIRTADVENPIRFWILTGPIPPA